MPLKLTSTAFADGQPIPIAHTRDGDNTLPPLAWSGEPAGTRSLVLVIEDPDAPKGLFRHLGAYDIPPGHHRLALDGAGPEAAIKFGRNDFGNTRYDGPEPPHGHGVHHYHFRLAALDVPHLEPAADAKVAEVWAAAEKHAIDTTELVGTYQR
jgi:Raf kinase inhibitor-like YbhB/YbcL family protein